MTYKDLENGGIYRAIRRIDPWKHRYKIDDVVLEMEASECLFQQLKTK